MTAETQCDKVVYKMKGVDYPMAKRFGVCGKAHLIALGKKDPFPKIAIPRGMRSLRSTICIHLSCQYIPFH
jgi:hypothetical protein